LRSYYLTILGLDLSATVQEIKSAYRRKSKEYHPDLNHSPDAQAKFLQIKEAYEYLTNQPFEAPAPEQYPGDGLTEQERWRRDYRKWAREKELEKQRQQMELIKKILIYFKPVGIVILIFNILLAIDFVLPLQSHDQKIISINKIFESTGRSGRSVHRYDEIHFEDFTMRLDRGEVILLKRYDKAMVNATMIFAKPMNAIITIDDKDELFKQIYNIYYIFGYLIPLMIILSIVYLKLKKPMQKFNVAIVLLVFGLIQLFLFTY